MVDTVFLNGLASKDPTPGGGGASAYGGALAAALASMVANLSMGKKETEAVEAQMHEMSGRLLVIRDALVALIDADADAFAPLVDAWAMSHQTPEEQAARDDAILEAQINACEPPLEIMKLSAEVIEICGFMAENGTRIAVSDAGVGALFAKAALLGASLNVRINCQTMKDEARAKHYLDDVDKCIAAYAPLADQIYEKVVTVLS